MPYETWPCSLLPALCTAPPPAVTTAMPWLEANAANALTAIVLVAVILLSTRHHRWESTQQARLERKKRWSAAPSYD